jgi:hypothetical protein
VNNQRYTNNISIRETKKPCSRGKLKEHHTNTKNYLIEKINKEKGEEKGKNM